MRTRRETLRAHGISVKAKGRIEDLIAAQGRKSHTIHTLGHTGHTLSVTPVTPSRATGHTLSVTPVTPSRARDQAPKKAQKYRTGRPTEWSDADLQQLVVLVDEARKAGITLRDAIEKTRHRFGKSYDACETAYKKEKRAAKSVPDKAIDKAIIAKVTKWGRSARPPLNPGETKALVAEAFIAAGTFGASWRQERFNEVFELSAYKWRSRSSGGIKYLQRAIAEFKKSPTWFPRTIPEFYDRTRRDRILQIVRTAPGQRANIALLMKETRWNRDQLD